MKCYQKDYPRPQLVRKHWINLNGEWDFAFDEKNAGEKEKWQEQFPGENRIQVPFTYETPMSGIGRQERCDRVWYRRKLQINKLEKKRYVLHFEGCDFYTKVWVNGQFAGSHKGGYSRFSFDVTGLLRDGENQICVSAEDSFDIRQPRGKQRWRKENFACWYVQTTGIWKTVWMEEVPDLYIKNLKITPLLQEQSVQIDWELDGDVRGKEAALEFTASFEGKLVYQSSQKVQRNYGTTVFSVFCDDDTLGEFSVMLWKPGEPNLYDLEVKLCTKESEDSVGSYFGMREIRIDKCNVLLNGNPLYQRLILDQGYWEDSHLTPPSEEALIEDIDKIMALGYNGVRKHQKTEDERFLYWCDVKGVLVWSEMASAYGFDDYAIEEFTKEWMEIVKQNYSHPCIVTWTPFNESWGIRYVETDRRQQHFTEEIYHLTKAIDPYRPVIVNDGWEHTVSDIITLHDYEEEGKIFLERYAKLKDEIMTTEVYHSSSKSAFANGYEYKGQPVIISEFGGIAFDGTGEGWGYGNKVEDTDEFIRRFDNITTAVKELPYACSYCYTQVTDVQQEINGLMDARRNFKVEPEKIREINERKVGYWRSYM